MASLSGRLTAVLFLYLILINSAAAQGVDAVLATGPGVGTTLEDHVEVSWSTASPVSETSTFTIERDGDLIGVVASTVTLYDDFTAVPGVTYNYCVAVKLAGGSETVIACDTGRRVIAQPTDFAASDGQFEDWVALKWTDQSQIETGYNVYRDAGNALDFDGVNDYVSVPGVTTLPASFTVEFRASRGGFGGNQYVFNLESSPQGSPTSVDLEIGFNSNNRLVVGFGTNQLTTPATYTDSNWHHVAVTYDAGSRRRAIYIDGVEVAFDIYGSPFLSDGTLELGRQKSVGNTNTHGYFKGQVDELRIWNSALGPVQIPKLTTDLPAGTEPGLVSLWPMDVASGLTVPDVVGLSTGTIFHGVGDAVDWVPSGIPDYHRQIGANLTSYLDRTTVSSFQSYDYRLAAFEDTDGDGVFTAGTDYESNQRNDSGWRAALSPPGNVAATDGQFLDRVRVTWTDLSDSETSFKIYRDGGPVPAGTVPADSTSFDDFAATLLHEYCVVASNGVESVRICDLGHVGGLPAPDDVAATDRVFDDRVVVTWSDTSNTEDGFEIFRQGSLIGKTGADAEEFSDLTALQEADSTYCVRAFSNADPGNPSYSSQVCAPATGARAAVLAPQSVAASDDDFEDRVKITWTNPSTTAMLFKVYRETTLIEVLDFSTTQTDDSGIPSDTGLQYCVVSETVVAPSSAAVLKGQVSSILEGLRYQDAISAETGGAATSPEAALATVYKSLGFDAVGKNGAVSGLVDSAPVCDTGSRLIDPPTAVDATDDEFESHVQITWDDNSEVETGYFVFRSTGGGTPVAIDTLSPNRKSYGDYTGMSGVQYNYIVQAFDAFDASSTESDLGKRTLSPPTKFRASDGTSETVVTLDWEDKSTAEAGYRIYRKIAGASGSPGLLGSTEKNELGYVDTVASGLLGNTFEYSVAAYDNFGESVQVSDEGRTNLLAPANVNASDVYPNQVVVVWTDKSGIEDGYHIERRGPSGVQILDGNLAIGATMYTDVTAVLGTKYDYCVKTRGGLALSDGACDEGSRFQESTGGGGGSPGLLATKIPSKNSSSQVDGAVDFGFSVAIDELGNALIGAPGADEVECDVLCNLLGGFAPGSSDGEVRRYTVDATNLWSKREVWGSILDEADWFSRSVEEEDLGYAIDLGETFTASGATYTYAIVGDPFLNRSALGGKRIERAGANPLTDWTESWANVGRTDIPPVGFSVAIYNQIYLSGGPENAHVELCSILGDCDITVGLSMESVVGLDLPANSEFGYSLDITRSGDSLYAIVGAPGADVAYMFKCEVVLDDGVITSCETASEWEYDTRLNSRFGPNKRFGEAVAVRDNIAVVGAPGRGGLVLYELVDGGWQEKLIFSPESDALGFGSAIAIQDTTVVVGAPRETIAGLENAGAAYVLEWDSNSRTFSSVVRYDARVARDNCNPASFQCGSAPTAEPAGTVVEGALFGTSVAIGSGFYLVGAPKDAVPGRGTPGAAYSIPFGLPAPDALILPAGVSLVVPGNVRAGDGTAPDRIQVRFSDESDDEDGHRVFRSSPDGVLEELADVAPNVEFFDDFNASPGEVYEYCVAAFFRDEVTERACDIGWRPPNGTIAGRLATRQGGGTDEALVCLDPNPNRSLLFDGFGGFVEVPLGEELDLGNDFTIEAWIRPNAVDGVRYIASKDSAFALRMNAGRLSFIAFGVDSLDATANPAMVAGNWYHVAVSIDQDANVAFFLDGVAEAGGTLGALFVNPLGDTLTVGQSGRGSGFFKGEIDEVRIWDTALSDSLIAQNRFEMLAGDTDDLIGYWPFDQGLTRLVIDETDMANHGRMIDGVYLTDQGAPLDVCVVSTTEGNYSIAGIRYGETTEFNVVPSRPRRVFEPTFKKITLSKESPVQNEVAFLDATAFGLAGVVEYVDVVGDSTLTCPAPDIQIHVDKDSAPDDENVRTTTKADGSYLVSVDPSTQVGDTWFVVPTFVSPANGELVHTFAPTVWSGDIFEDRLDFNFADLERYALSGNFSGGDPDLCGRDIGKAVIRIYTQDGCYSRVDTVDSGVSNGAFSFNLPPLKYLIDIQEIIGAPTDRAEEIAEFFKALGTVEVDLSDGPVERNLIYRAPLMLTISGLDPPVCAAGISQKDGEGNVIRTLPSVPTIGESQFKPITIGVQEDYGNGQFCSVDEGTVTVFDAIADRVDHPDTLQIKNGVAVHQTFGASANIFSGARIQGVDRSFQKPITFVTQVEGRERLTETRWALVEGIRERSATFVSATTEEFPLLIVHDPPGSNSSAFLEEGATMCTSILNTKLVGGGAGADLDLRFGFNSQIGLGLAIENGGGVSIGARIVAGQDVTSLVECGEPLPPDVEKAIGKCDLHNRAICVSTTENFATSSDPGGVGEDIHIGVALNLIFAIADVLDYNSCQVELSETLAADLNESKPFETSYVYTKTHIAASLIPELENLVKLAGSSSSVTGPLGGATKTIRLQDALDNWKKQLANNEKNKEQALANPEVNRSFSGNTEFSYTQSFDTTTTTHFESTRIYLDTEGHVGGVATLAGNEQEITVVFEVRAEWVTEEDSTQGATRTLGYVLNDEDTGDYFSVDVARDPMYQTFVFGTRSGRSSNPWEANTQKRDNPIIMVDPPVLFNVDPEGAGSFDLTLINGSESNERRRYALTAPAETNRNNLTLTTAGGYLDGEPYLLDPGKAITVKLDVFPGPSAYSYQHVGVVLYPEAELDLWTGDTRQPFVLSDTAFFTVYFDSTGGGAFAAPMAEGWTWFSLNRSGGDLNTVLQALPATDGDIIRSQSAESRFDSTNGWRGSLTNLVPGTGYRIRLKESTVFRVVGDAPETTEAIKLTSGWNWLGYLPTRRLPIDFALASLKAKVKEGDIIVGQEKFAQYVNGHGWLGTLQEMAPGESYALNLTVGAELLYPTSDEGAVWPTSGPRESTTQGPTWEIESEQFDGVMSMVAEVQLDGEPLEQTVTRVAVFAGDSLRGVGDVQYVESLDRYLAFVLIYGITDDENLEELRVHVYDGDDDILYENVGSLQYATETMLGQPADPVALELSAAGLAPQLLEVPEVFALHGNYPNPFNPTTTIAYDLPEAVNVNLTIFDLLGRKVITLVNGENRAGRHKVVFDAGSVASGFYLYRIEAGDFREVRKMILVK